MAKGKCLRCGRPVIEGVTICGVCNPAGLKQPSATQFHGTVYAIIGVVVVAALVIAPLFIGGTTKDETGLHGEVTAIGQGVEPIQVTLAVKNSGATTTRAACRLAALNKYGAPVGNTVVTTPMEIPAGESVSFETSLATTVQPDKVNVTCSQALS